MFVPQGPSAESIQKLCDGTPYRVTRLLGRGGMADVWAVEHEFLGREFALKVVHACFGTKPKVIDRLRLEAQVTALLEHPNIVPVIDFWVSDGARACLVTELMSGQTLAKELRDRTRLPLSEVAAIGCQVLRALAAAHERDILHRDIKPENIFLDELPGAERTAKVLDFGLARVTRDSQHHTIAPALEHTRTGGKIGTPLYMSPEARRAEPLDCRADIYSLGVTLYEGLCGNDALFWGDRFDRPQPPSTLLDGIPPDLDELLLSAMDENVDRRPQTAREFELRLCELLPARKSRSPIR